MEHSECNVQENDRLIAEDNEQDSDDEWLCLCLMMILLLLLCDVR